MNEWHSFLFVHILPLEITLRIMIFHFVLHFSCLLMVLFYTWHCLSKHFWDVHVNNATAYKDNHNLIEVLKCNKSICFWKLFQTYQYWNELFFKINFKLFVVYKPFPFRIKISKGLNDCPLIYLYTFLLETFNIRTIFLMFFASMRFIFVLYT